MMEIRPNSVYWAVVIAQKSYEKSATNSKAIKHKPPEVIKKFLSHDPSELCISSITYADLTHCVEKSMAVRTKKIAVKEEKK